MKAKTFERKFDDGQDITQALDLTKARRPLQAQRRVNVDFPTWMIDRLASHEIRSCYCSWQT